MGLAHLVHAETWTTWQAAHFTAAEIQNAALSGMAADPDGDGANNLLEYAFAGDPRIPEANLAPVIGLNSNNALTLTHRRLRAATDLFTSLQASQDLTDGWYFPEGATAIVDSSQAIYDLITLTELEASQSEQRFLRLTVAIDADQDSLPDDWEMRFFGNLDHLAGDDEDFDLLTNLMEYHQQTNPSDFYNGETPLVSITGGNGQMGFAQAALPVTLAVTVFHRDGTTPWPNAPVIFSTAAGGYFSNGSSPTTVRADDVGVARASYYLPQTVGPLAITTTAGQAPNLSSVIFSESVSALPPTMGPLTTQGNGSDIQISWTALPGASSYSLARFNAATQTWENIAQPGAGDVGFNDPAQPPDTIVLYKMSATDGSLVASSKVQAGIANPEGNGDTDGLLNGDEVQAGYYAQALAATPSTDSHTKLGGNPAGWVGPDPKLGDTDSDGTPDDRDGWANNNALQPARQPERHYAVLDLTKMGFPADFEVQEINDLMQALGTKVTGTGRETILWDMRDQSVTPVPVLSGPEDIGGNWWEDTWQRLNNSGTVCGRIAHEDGSIQAATWSKAGGVVLLPYYNAPALNGATNLRHSEAAILINNTGTVVGHTSSAGSVTQDGKPGTLHLSGSVKWGAPEPVGDIISYFEKRLPPAY